MELGTVRPAAMLSREQFNVIIHSQPAMAARRNKKEGMGMNVVDRENSPLSFGNPLHTTEIQGISEISGRI